MPKIATLASAFLIVAAAAGPQPALAASEAASAATAPVSDKAFCLRAQRLLTATTLEPAVVRHETWQSFKDSKSTVRPFEIHQFVTADAATKRLPVLVSCKIKSADHIVATYGASAAAAATRSCAEIDRDTVRRVFATLTPGERARAKLAPGDIVYDDELRSYIGPRWLAPFDYAYASGGRLHLATKTLAVDWNDVLWKWAPEKVRGVHYCHNVAPEYLRRLVLGEATAPSRGASR
jgi:hypothetical protein